MNCCPICESTKCKICLGTDGVYCIDCIEGFSFEICQSFDNLSDIEKRKIGNLVLEWLLSHTKDNSRPRFIFNKDSESLIIENNEINLSSLIETYPKTVIERVNRALINLACQYPNIGEQIGTKSIDTALVFVESEDYIIGGRGIFGILEELEYITNTVSNGSVYRFTAKGWLKIEELREYTYSSKQAFIAMSFGEKTKDIRSKFRKAIIECGYNPIFIDEKEHNNQIVPEILYEIQKSKFVVVDVTEPNYGAYYEAGYALGLNKQVIICCDKNVLQGEATKSRPHFDIAQKSMVIWKDLDDLEKRLINRIKSTIN